VLSAQENVVSENINGRPELQAAKDDLEALLPTIDPACDLLKRMIMTPDTPYGTALGPLRKLIDDAEDIIRSVYPNDEPDFPRALGLAGEPVGPVPGEEDAPDAGRAKAVRLAQGCANKIREVIELYIARISAALAA
jgi:hypothetical protein